MNLFKDLTQIFTEKSERGNPVRCTGGFYKANAILEALKEIELSAKLSTAGIEKMPKAHVLLLYMLSEMAEIDINTYLMECPKGGTHRYGTDGMHSNLFCKKCYRNAPDGYDWDTDDE